MVSFGGVGGRGDEGTTIVFFFAWMTEVMITSMLSLLYEGVEKLGTRASVVDRLHSVAIVSWPATI